MKKQKVYGCPVLTLNKDTLGLIMEILPAKDVCALRMTCSAMRVVGNKEHVWAALTKRDFGAEKHPAFDKDRSWEEMYRDEVRATRVDCTLSWCAKNGDMRSLRSHIRRKETDIDATGSGDRTPLHWAAIGRHFEVVNLLLDAGADVNASTSYGRTSLHQATRDGCVDMARLLLDAGADVDATDSGDRTPLHWAAIGIHSETVGLLLDAGANVNVRDSFGRTPLELAARDGYDEVVSLLLDAGASPWNFYDIIPHGFRFSLIHAEVEKFLRNARSSVVCVLSVFGIE